MSWTRPGGESKGFRGAKRRKFFTAEAQRRGVIFTPCAGLLPPHQPLDYHVLLCGVKRPAHGVLNERRSLTQFLNTLDLSEPTQIRRQVYDLSQKLEYLKNGLLLCQISTRQPRKRSNPKHETLQPQTLYPKTAFSTISLYIRPTGMSCLPISRPSAESAVILSLATM